jgi:aminocarboxymuconate-semialdehyde decarboxylase
MHEDCNAGHGLPRRQMIQGGLATAAVSALGASAATTAAGEAQAAAGAEGTRAIDIHAHYYPQAYLDVMAEQGKQYGFD